MQSIITRQYARDIEIPIAEFINAADANFFIKAIEDATAILGVNAIYRQYRDGKFVNEFNRGKINVFGGGARYFSGEEIPSMVPDAYEVFSQDLGNPVLIAKFAKLEEARLFIEGKRAADLTANKKITYRILQHNQMVEKFDPATPVAPAAEKQQENTQGGAGNKTSFRPTPFNTVPRPAGSPQGWIKENSRERAGEKEEEK